MTDISAVIEKLERDLADSEQYKADAERLVGTGVGSMWIAHDRAIGKSDGIRLALSYLMTGRERIEQAAKENGWSVEPYDDNQLLLVKGDEQFDICFTTDGDVEWVTDTSAEVAVIAYLQQHKEAG